MKSDKDTKAADGASGEPSASRMAGRAVRGGAMLLAARLLVQALLWVVTIWVARLLEPADYGMMTWGMIFVGLADILAEAGAGRALIQKKDLTHRDQNCAFTLSLSLSVGLYLLIWLSAPLVSRFLVRDPAFCSFLRTLGILILLIPFRTIALAMLDRQQKLAGQAITHIITATVQSTLVLTLALQGKGYWALATGALTGRIIEMILLVLLSRWIPGLAWPSRDQWGLIWFGVHASLGTLLWYFYSKADVAIVGEYLGTQVLGWYSLAFQLISLPVEKLTANANQVAYPVFCRLQGDRERLRNWYLRLTVQLGFFGMPSLAGMALVAPEAFRLILGEKWMPAVTAFRMLSVVGIVMLYGATLPPLFNSLGRPDLNLRYTATCATVMPAAFFVGGKTLGLPGICLAWLIFYPLIVAGYVFLTEQISGIRLRDLLAAQRDVVAGVLVMAGVVWLTRQAVAPLSRDWLTLLLPIGSGVAAYSAYMLVLGRATLTDFFRLLQELRGRKLG